MTPGYTHAALETDDNHGVPSIFDAFDNTSISAYASPVNTARAATSSSATGSSDAKVHWHHLIPGEQNYEEGSVIQALLREQLVSPSSQQGLPSSSSKENGGVVGNHFAAGDDLSIDTSFLRVLYAIAEEEGIAPLGDAATESNGDK